MISVVVMSYLTVHLIGGMKYIYERSRFMAGGNQRYGALPPPTTLPCEVLEVGVSIARKLEACTVT